ncbi:hypothetical protein EUX98_g8433 [Antrodiella citrinella]|uniref:SnoaL-like domain-containing protein n=1 Tax=Antrodiella citrinella TaxID=2447956 RepID=A0A4S4M8Y1_9APHY|nr:hypothetical protein EUX98_g8433 [Antrodiella citrinella]
MSPLLTRSRLMTAASKFCNSFASQADTDEILDHFSTTYAVSAKEHGLPLLAPFVGRQYSGLRGGLSSVESYFKLLQKHIKYEEMSFGEWVIDSEARRVSCKGRAKFIWTEGDGEGQSWDESFVYLLDFDEEAKVTDYQVWADSGAAYLASIGKLKEKQEVCLFSVIAS